MVVIPIQTLRRRLANLARAALLLSGGRGTAHVSPGVFARVSTILVLVFLNVLLALFLVLLARAPVKLARLVAVLAAPAPHALLVALARVLVEHVAFYPLRQPAPCVRCTTEGS